MLSWQIRGFAKRLAFDKLLKFAETFKSPCRGVHDTWEEAQLAIPKGSKVGYDHAEMTSFYLDYTDKLRPSDYPVLFWMKSAIGESSSVFDLGGNIGLEFYSFQKYLEYPHNFRWTVCDLPEITRFGGKLAEERKASGLRFTQAYEDADGSDIFLTAGTLSFMQTDLSSILSKLQAKPRHLLVNRAPLYDGKTFFTVRRLPPIMAVYRVFNKKEFIDSILANGYRLIDEWTIEGTVVIPFRRDKAVSAYSGLYFRLET
jgi:putative methyltransferase (TIGR04325 family)